MVKKVKNVLLATILAGMVFAGSAQAAVSFGTYKDGSTLSWETVVNTHRDHPEISTEVTVLDTTSASLRGIYNGGDSGDSVMYTSLTLNAGDTVSFDWSLSNNGNNIPDFNGGNWVGDSTFHFKTVANGGNDPKVTERFIANNTHHEYDNGVDGWHDNIADMNTGVHVEYVFGQTDYTITVTSLVDSLVTSGGTRDYLDGLTVSDIQSFRVGIWDSEQTVTVSNFNVVPEPASMLILGLGGLFASRKRHS